MDFKFLFYLALFFITLYLFYQGWKTGVAELCLREYRLDIQVSREKNPIKYWLVMLFYTSLCLILLIALIKELLH